ncbi:MAG: hypothetical protein IPM71_12565 [Bacteroidota bacterium]|nr:MAG: hypothetical protein IPM71_12565 [Bacteroidota bacterium]
MKSFLLSILFSALVLIPALVSGTDDSTLYVKTIYQHEIFNGRNTARKAAIKLEMRDATGELFRESYFNANTKAEEYILYYYYNADKTIRLVEKNNPLEQLIEYYTYNYKKGKLQNIKHYQYQADTKTSSLMDTRNYIRKKNTLTIHSQNAGGVSLKTEVITYNKMQEIRNEITNHLADSAYKTIFNFEYNDTLLTNKYETIISKNQDSIKYWHNYIYNAANQLEKINTYLLPANEKIHFYTVFKYMPGGSLENERRVNGTNDFYLYNYTTKYTVYTRQLPRKDPVF